MKLRTFARTLLVGLAVTVSIGIGAPACTKDAPVAKVANVKAGPMPKNGNWEGVFYSPLFGELDIQKEAKGSGYWGRWERPVKDRWGELHGTVEGNLFKFTWREVPYGLITPTSEKTGKGYLVYNGVPEGQLGEDNLKGEIGRGDDEIGTEWTAIRQGTKKPDPTRFGNASAQDVGGGDWDTGNKEGGKPEKPKPPASAKPPEL